MGAVIAILGAVTFALGSWATGLPLLVFGALIAGLGVLARLSGDAVPVLNTAHNTLLQGRVADAERILDQAEARWQLPHIRGVIDLQRAVIAVRRGDLEAALARVEAMLARAPGSRYVPEARALRALLRVAHPEAAGAGEVERLREELRLDPALSRWLEIVAPSVLRAFSAPPPARDAEAEREALADEERSRLEAAQGERR